MEDQKSSDVTQNPAATPSPLWTTDDVARYARCSIRHVTTLREQGLPFRKLGHLVRFNPEAVKRWLED